MSEKELENYLQLVTLDINELDNLPEKVQDALIQYLQEKIRTEEILLSQLEELSLEDE